MNIRDRIGKRGEAIFAYVIMEWCNGRPWLDANFLGDKHQGKDFIVELVDPNSRYAMLQVQVKSTRSRSRGSGADRKLVVNVSRDTVEYLQAVGTPAYVVGVDIDAKQAFIK